MIGLNFNDKEAEELLEALDNNLIHLDVLIKKIVNQNAENVSLENGDVLSAFEVSGIYVEEIIILEDKKARTQILHDKVEAYLKK